MATGLQVELRDGGDTIDLGESSSSCSWTTNALGGFGSATFSLPGDPKTWLWRVPKLARIQLVQDQTVVFEGQVEDHEYTISSGEMSTTVQCFGLARALDEINTRRIWLKRDVEFEQGQTSLWTPDLAYVVTTGNFLPTDLTKSGIRFSGTGVAATVAKKTYFRIRAPEGMTFTSVHGAYQKAGSANLVAEIWSSTDYATYTNHLSSAANVTSDFDYNTVASAVDVLFGVTSLGVYTPTLADFAQFYSLSVSGIDGSTWVSGVDYTGTGATLAYYGGAILKDLHSWLASPEVGWPLYAGNIDGGTEFGIESLEGTFTSFARDVVEEVASYYTKEWGVWEDGRFDWEEINLDYVHWIIDVSDLESLNLRSSVDEISTLEIVVYEDAASGRNRNAVTRSTSRKNPYVLRGRRKDKNTSPGFPMTENTAQQLAAKLTAARSDQAFASGNCSLRYRTAVSRANGGAMPAYAIRAGQNIKITGLPKSDPFNTGRDGETLFHIVSTQSDTDGVVTLTLDSQSTAIDSLMARLAAATRRLTG